MYYYIGAPYKTGTVPPWGGAVSTKDGYSCASGASGTTSTAYAVCVNDGTSVSNPASSCRNFTYPTSDNINVSTNSYVANTNTAANQFCTSK